jgi:hypothetical protein
MKGPRCSAFAGVAAATLVAIGWAAPVWAQWQIESKDGTSTIQLGFLAQPQFESLETSDLRSATGATVASQNIFLRRWRILFGGTLSEKWTFFFETDSPNLGKQVATATAKDAGSLYIQDAYITFSYSDALKIDGGFLLVPISHNHQQSATSLLGIDYLPYAFNENSALQERVGRDYGVELRGYPLRKHLEYRLGVFQGVRGEQARNGFRVAGRAVWYPFAADTGFFYTGTFQGTKRIVALGASFDTQNAPPPVAPATARERYSAYALDAFVEQPIHVRKTGVSAQFDWVRFSGGTLAPTLPKQNVFLAEGGFHFGSGHYTPFVQYAKDDFVAQPTLANTTCWQAGLAWWMSGHRRNLKFSAGRTHADALGEKPAIDRTQVLAQLQIFTY